MAFQNRKGSPNKRTLILHELTREAGLNAVQKFNECLEKVQDPAVKASLLLKFMEFFFPKRREQEGAIGDEKTSKEVLVYDRYQNMSAEQLKELVKKDLEAEEKANG